MAKSADWVIVIQGHGPVDGQAEDDADVLFARFVDQLREAGQGVRHAVITTGATLGPGSVRLPE